MKKNILECIALVWFILMQGTQTAFSRSVLVVVGESIVKSIDNEYCCLNVLLCSGTKDLSSIKSYNLFARRI